jgi:hypothetical protein
MMRLLKYMAAEMKARGSSIVSITYEDPSEIAEGGGQMFGILPFTMEMTAARGQGSQRSFLIGVSSDRGKTWTFIDGVQANPGNVKQLVPDFPEKLHLPQIQQPQLRPKR